MGGHLPILICIFNSPFPRNPALSKSWGDTAGVTLGGHLTAGLAVPPCPWGPRLLPPHPGTLLERGGTVSGGQSTLGGTLGI